MEANMNKQKVKAKGTAEMADVISCLEDILDSMKSGKVFLEHGGDQILLTPGGLAEVEIEAEQKDGKQELSLEFKWKERLDSSPKLDLKISSEERSRVAAGDESDISEPAEKGADVHPEEELRRYTGTEAFGLEPEEFSPTN
jgi:amphi-Trp domain-containing protein